MDLTVRAHPGDAALDGMAREWHQLLKGVPEASAFATPGWARAWWATYGRHHRAVVVEVRDGARLVALLRVGHQRSWEEYRASLSKPQRQDTRYKPNELTRAVGAELRLDAVRGAAAGAAVEEFIALFSRRWSARGKPGLLSGEDDMYRNLVRDEPSLVV